MSAADELAALMADRGRLNYGENVTIAEHSLLTAAAAEQQGHHDTLVAACLMHDMGHWLDEPDDGYGIHDHGGLGGDWVAARFDAAVSEPVRLHIEAKRFLCVRESDYHDRLSPASKYTLTKQGGPMTADEAEVFEARPHAADAVLLRRLEDDHGKLTDIEVPSLSHFRSLLDGLEAGGS
ncbi:MAG: metal-dependent phosphohydrolase [Actinomycetota bacterium]|nr:metal-dependent phosphohydrolase [Actinomycetota bacterium]